MTSKLLNALEQEPAQFDFYQAVYALERQLCAERKRWQGVGRDGFPAKEIVRFKSVQHLGFPGQPIAKVKYQLQAQDNAGEPIARNAVMHVSFMGLTGPSGVLPQHYSEMVLQRIKQRDNTMRDFFDLFNHRLISLYYRAWEKYRFACQYEMTPDNQDSFSQVLSKLGGGSQSLSLYYAGAFSQKHRSAAQLSSILSELLQLRVDISPLRGRWLQVQQQEQSKLGGHIALAGGNNRLGHTAMLGQRVWDVSSAVRISLYVKSKKATDLLPGSYQHQLLKTFLHDYLPPSMQIEIALLGQCQDFPTAQLGGTNSRLGQSGNLAVRQSMQQQATQLHYRMHRA